MKSLDECIAEIKRVDLHVEELEKLIKLILVNNLIDEATCLENHDKLEINENIISALEKYNLEIGKQDMIEDSKILYVVVSNSIGIKDIMYLHDLFIEFQPDIELVFQFEKINGMQRKRMIQEKISYHVVGKELHIFSLRGM